MARETVQPEFAEYMNPLLRALVDLGGSGRPAEVCEHVASELGLSNEILDAVLKNGQSRFENQVAWARYYLAQRGYIDSSNFGVWRLTEKAQGVGLTDAQVTGILRAVRDETRRKREARERATGQLDEGPEEDGEAATLSRLEGTDHREELGHLLKSLPSEGFERLCQRVLREAGFREVVVTGRSGDGGIDGNGILQMNPLFSVKVLFQCKRYSGAVGAPQIRDFQGALRGRADKGLLLTTGAFTAEAKKEASRDGAEQIELIDLNRLIDLFENLNFGLRRQTVFEVEEAFFDEFR